MTEGFLLNQFLVGLSMAAVLFLVSSGLNIIFGILGIVNFAHASLYTLGAYFAFTVASLTDNFWLALIFAPLFVAIIGALIESSLLRLTYKLDHVYQILLTFGLILIFEDLTKMIWGTSPLTISGLGGFLSSTINVGGSPFPIYFLFVIAMGVIIAFGLIIFLDKTRPGMMLKAAITRREMAEACGLNVKRLFTLVFAGGAALGGLGGVLAGGVNTMQPDMGMSIIIESFAVVVMGGLGNIYGAMLGSIIIGLWKAFGILVFPEFSMLFVYIVMAAVLLWKPDGLLGSQSAPRKA